MKANELREAKPKHPICLHRTTFSYNLTKIYSLTSGLEKHERKFSFASTFVFFFYCFHAFIFFYCSWGGWPSL